MAGKSYNDILTFAIGNEVKAREFYLEVAEKTRDTFLKELFTELAEEEGQHRAVLENFQRSESSVIEFKDVPDYHVSESVDEPHLSTNMKPADAFALAMKKEQQAMELYTWMAGIATDVRQKELLTQLATMEKQHKARMESAFVNVGYPEVW
ncbi:MAG: ferritin family protein [Dehalococcoidia bacterium]